MNRNESSTDKLFPMYQPFRQKSRKKNNHILQAITGTVLAVGFYLMQVESEWLPYPNIVGIIFLSSVAVTAIITEKESEHESNDQGIGTDKL